MPLEKKQEEKIFEQNDGDVIHFYNFFNCGKLFIIFAIELRNIELVIQHSYVLIVGVHVSFYSHDHPVFCQL